MSTLLNQTHLLRVEPSADLPALIAELRGDPNVVAAEPNHLYAADAAVEPRAPAVAHVPVAGQSAVLPNDPFLASSGSWGDPFPDLWGVLRIEAAAAWQRSRGAGAVVAVVDTGLDLHHPDIVANLFAQPGEIADNGLDDDANGFIDDVNGWDFTRCGMRNSGGDCLAVKEPGRDLSDPRGHGTHVAGTIAATGDNGIGIIGVAPQAQVMAIKGLDAAGSARRPISSRRWCTRRRTARR
jgi:subtilisin family serine protease